MVGLRPLKAAILVRIQASEQKLHTSQETLFMLQFKHNFIVFIC